MIRGVVTVDMLRHIYIVCGLPVILWNNHEPVLREKLLTGSKPFGTIKTSAVCLLQATLDKQNPNFQEDKEAGL